MEAMTTRRKPRQHNGEMLVDFRQGEFRAALDAALRKYDCVEPDVKQMGKWQFRNGGKLIDQAGWTQADTEWAQEVLSNKGG